MSPAPLPVTSGAKVMRALETIEFVHVSTRGDHAKLRRTSDRRTVIVPLHKELKRGTLASILRQCGLTTEELRSLL